MPSWFWSLAAIVAAYLLGSLSFAVIVSRVMGLSDPRKYGSGNPGATNVLRSGNRTAAILTLVFDRAVAVAGFNISAVSVMDQPLEGIYQATGATLAEAEDALGKAGNHSKLAILMILTGADAAPAREKLKAASGVLRRAIAGAA